MIDDALPTAHELVARLGLVPHPEGGFYRETHRDAFELDALAPRFSARRSASTAIYYLLERGDFSALHRIRSDEVWHHYLGATLTVHVFGQERGYVPMRVGKRLSHGDAPQAVVPAGAWFGSRIEANDPGDYALVGCTVAPGFDFADFELGTREHLLATHPDEAELVTALTRI